MPVDKKRRYFLPIKPIKPIKPVGRVLSPATQRRYEAQKKTYDRALASYKAAMRRIRL